MQNYALLRMLLNYAITLILSIPYFMINNIFSSVKYYFPYIFIMIIMWRYFSIPIAARQISKNSYKLIELI